MHQSRYIIMTDADAARIELATSGAVAIGGGTDLITRLADGLLHAETLIDVRRIPGWSQWDWDTSDDLSIGGAVRLQALADDPIVSVGFPALAQACLAVGTPALRAMGTLAGNLCQAPRCWYWRGGTPCRRTDPALACHAVHGHSEYHAVFDVAPCAVVHPSDPAVALLALDAEVEILGAAGLRRVPLADLYPSAGEVEAATGPLRDTTLAADELIAAIVVPFRSAGGRQRYVKLTQRAAWDFALVSCAATRSADGTVRLALGGVAARPWLVPPALLTEVNASIAISPEAASTAFDQLATRVADRVAALAEPLAGSAYKVTLVRHLVEDAVRYLNSPE